MKSIISSEHKTPVLLFLQVMGILGVDTFLLLCIFGGLGQACQYAASVKSICPLTNQRSSSIILWRNVFLVVRRGRVEFARDKRREGGAKKERVLVPVLEDMMGMITTSMHCRMAESQGQSSSGRVPLLPYSRSLCLSLVVWELPRFPVWWQCCWNWSGPRWAWRSHSMMLYTTCRSY